MKNLRFTILILISIFGVSGFVQAQTKTRKPTKKVTKKTEKPAADTTQKTAPVVEVKEDEQPIKNTGKKNERPTIENVKNNAAKPGNSVYFYEFAQPDFVTSKILIETDENGKGQITFMKKGWDETVTDPIQLTPEIQEKLKTLWTALNFLDSTENYQSAERDYKHLGTIKVRMKLKERERTAEFNWTENKDAKELAAEYWRIGQQFIWMFDIGVARVNQPLETPGLMDALDSLIRRNEISSPSQMLPFLKELSGDERMPLIARNHATRIIKEIEKKVEKEKNSER